MKAENILELINESTLTPEEHQEYQSCMEWVKKHDGKVSMPTPVGKLALIAYLAEKEIREESVKTKLGASAVSVAKLVNKYMEEPASRWKGAAMGDAHGERCQVFLLRGCLLVALKEPNDLIEKSDDDNAGEQLSNLLKKLEMGNFRDIKVNPDDIEVAYKLSRTRGSKQSSKSPKKYPPITMNGKGYDAELVRDAMKILGTDHMTWMQEVNSLSVDIIETDRGVAAICPVKIDEETLVEDHPLKPIAVNVED